MADSTSEPTKTTTSGSTSVKAPATKDATQSQTQTTNDLNAAREQAVIAEKQAALDEYESSGKHPDEDRMTESQKAAYEEAQKREQAAQKGSSSSPKA